MIGDSAWGDGGAPAEEFGRPRAQVPCAPDGPAAAMSGPG